MFLLQITSSAELTFWRISDSFISVMNYCSSDMQISLKQKFASENLTYEELNGLMNDFIVSANNGTHAQRGWPNSTYVVSKVGLSAMSRMQQR